MTETQYDKSNLNESPYSEGFSEVPKIDFSSLVINGESTFPVIHVQEGFSKLEEKAK